MSDGQNAVVMIIADAVRRGRRNLASDNGTAKSIVLALSDAGYVITPRLPLDDFGTERLGQPFEAIWDQNAERIYEK